MSTDIEQAVRRLLLTPHEAAQSLGISERHLWAQTAPRGPIPSIKIGRNRRYDPDAVRAAVKTLATA